MPSGRAIRRLRRAAGFTLIELLVVVAMVSLLLTVVAPRYFQSVERARITVLQENLRVTREAIDLYYADRKQYPDSLDELVTYRYLRTLPVDPTAAGSMQWLIVAPPVGLPGKVYDLHSTSTGMTADGKRLGEL